MPLDRALDLLEYLGRRADPKRWQEGKYQEAEEAEEFNPEVANDLGSFSDNQGHHPFAGMQKMPSASRSLVDWAEEQLRKMYPDDREPN